MSGSKENSSMAHVAGRFLQNLSQEATGPIGVNFRTIQEAVEENTGKKPDDTYLAKKTREIFAGQGIKIHQPKKGAKFVEISEELFSPDTSPGETRFGTNLAGPSKRNSAPGKTSHSLPPRKTNRS